MSKVRLVLGVIIMVPCFLVGVIAGIALPIAIVGTLIGSVPIGTTLGILVAAVVANLLGAGGLLLSGIMHDDE